MKLIYLVSMLFTLCIYLMSHTLTVSVTEVHYSVYKHMGESNPLKHTVSTILEFIAKLLIAFYICLILLFFYILIEIAYRREVKRLK